MKSFIGRFIHHTTRRVLHTKSAYLGLVPGVSSSRRMCILFAHVGANDPESDYQLIVVSNRDEYYDRPTKTMTPWIEDPDVIGSRDLEAECGGTWLAVSPLRKKIGVLLNLPGVKFQNAKSRGKIVADFVKSESSMDEYVENMKSYFNACNEFVFVAFGLGSPPTIQTYSNATDKILNWNEDYLGFGNSLPDQALEKVKAGRMKLQNICSRLKKISDKEELVKQLVDLLKSEERHLPDIILENRHQPGMSQYLSSIFVCMPEGRYGTRTHTVILLTKRGQLDILEISLKSPVDSTNPQWGETEFQYKIPQQGNL